MIKITVLYGHPIDAKAFESYYFATHMPIAAKIPGLARAELTRFTTGPNGEPAYYRMAELYFPSLEQMQAALQSVEGAAAVNDLPNFASGGATMLVGTVD